MTHPLEESVRNILAAAPKRLYLQEIQAKLRATGVVAGRDDIATALAALVKHGLITHEPPGWRFAGRARPAINPPPTPLIEQLNAARQIPSTALGATAQLPIPPVDDEAEENAPTSCISGGRWQRLRRLLAYYQDCLVTEDAPEIRGFLDSIHEQWLPVVGTIPWDTLQPGRSGFSISLQDKQGRFQQNRARRGEDMSLYLGYPVKVWKKKGRADEAFAVPVFVQPVEADWESHAIHIAPDGQPTVNSAWASYAFKDRQEREAFFRMVGLGDRGENAAPMALPTMDGMATRMANWFDNPVVSPIDPLRLERDETYDQVETGFYNRAVLMLGPKLKFTKSLLRELRAIAAWPDADIDKSALRFLLPCDDDTSGQAWPWQPHPSGLKPDRVAMTNILFGAQREAVVHANSRPVTVITGPPGTGKSEVVRAILVNQLLRGRPTLMASRNHGAIEAVVPRLNELGGGEPVVIRASSPDLRSRNGWKDQLRMLLARPQVSHTGLIDAHLETVVRIAANLAEAASRYGGRSVLELAYAEAGMRHGNCMARTAAVSADPGLVTTWNPEHTRLLADLRALADSSDRPLGWWRRLLNRLLGRTTVPRAERIGGVVAQLPPLVTPGLDQRLATWQAIAEAAESTVRLREIETRLADHPPPDVDASIASEVSQLRTHVHDLLRLLAGGSGAVHIDQETRQRMRNLWAGMENFSGKRFNDQLRTEFPLILKAFPLWCVTNLSVKSAIPLIPGAFDLVVIDEASQCDIPSVIPLLARARRAAIVGDPMQLTHITKMAPDQEQVLLSRHGLADFDVQRFSYRINSCYGLGEAANPVEQPLLLDVHLRCHADIAEFAGKTFYRGGLRVGTDPAGLRAPPGKRAGIHWTDVVSSIESSGNSVFAPAEVDACVRLLRELQDSGYAGTVGVVTPFRPNATRIGDAVATAIRPEVLEKWDFHSSTAHGFQGDERDLMLYSVCGGDQLSPTSAGWLASPEGRCLMNVAITRARAVLHVVGNQAWAESSGIPHLSSLARSCRARVEHVTPPKYESVWEERFDTALRAAGVPTVIQHPVAHRRLDIAVLHPVKLDIEVDGESTHRASGGRRKDDDHWRDIQMTALGWTVLRFWVYELRDNMPACIARVRSALTPAASSTTTSTT